MRKPEIASDIAEIQDALGSFVSERDLLDALKPRLARLRESYKRDPSRFTPSDIDNLRSIQPIISALEDFESFIEEKASDENPQRLSGWIAELRRISLACQGLAIDERIRKEVRELSEIERSRPNQTPALDRVVRGLQREASHCRKCGSKLILREGDHGYFWGCSRFPDCFGKAGLTLDQARKLSDP